MARKEPTAEDLFALTKQRGHCPIKVPDAFALYTKPKHTKNLRVPLSVALGGKPALTAAPSQTAQHIAEGEALLAEQDSPVQLTRRKSRTRETGQSSSKTILYKPEHIQLMAAHPNEVSSAYGCTD